MKLTGKAKEQFEDWLNTQKGWKDNWYGGVLLFEGMPNQMQWGVFQDFADSLGYELYLSKESPLEYFWAVCDLIRSFNEGNCKTRQEARNAAIEKLNEIINQA